VRQEGEIAYNQERMREARRWVQTHPVSFIRLTLKPHFGTFGFRRCKELGRRRSIGLLTIFGFLWCLDSHSQDQMAIWLILPLWVVDRVSYAESH